MSGKDARKVKEAAAMVRGMMAACPVPRCLPSQHVLRMAALNLRLELPDILKTRNAKRLAEAGLVREHATALFRAFPDAGAADRLGTAGELLLGGLAPRLVKPALDAWGVDAGRKVARDPYGSLWELRGVRVDEADALALAAASTTHDRILGHVRWHTLSAKRDGHTMLPKAELVHKIQGSFSTNEVQRALDQAVAGGSLVTVGAGLADPESVATEMTVATEIKKRAGVSHLAPPDAAALAGLSPEQVAAVTTLCSASISVLTGGPGTGKSTVVRALVSAFGGEDKCMLTAPTGRAARNLGGNTVHSASGGRLLRRRPLQETTKADVPDDLVAMFVDEASMLTTELILGVLNLAPPRCHVVLVGDADQLPPVGTGNVLCDLIETGAVPVARLGYNHRCPDDIQALASAVLEGRVPTSLGPNVQLRPGNAMRLAVGAVVQDKAQILTPHNAQRTLLNRAVQSAIRQVGVVASKECEAWGIPAQAACILRTDPAGQATLHAPNGKSVRMPIDDVLSVVRCPHEARETLLPGDSVMVLKNQNKKRLAAGEVSACNGDIGTLVRGSGLGATKALVEFGPGGCTSEFPKVDGWLTLAYAATVHKFQGSECEVVALPVAQSSAWDRTLLYTAVTRAKSRVIVLGGVEDLRVIVARKRVVRHSILQTLLS